MNTATDYKGLIYSTQQTTLHTESQYWKYGIVHNDKKIVDAHLHYGCFVLGYTGNDEFLDRVHERLKSTKPEIADNFFGPAQPLRINHASYELADKLFNLSGGYRSFFALSGSDANEGAVKLASAYHHCRGQLQRNRVVSIANSYHGSTWLTKNLSKPTQKLYTLDLDSNFVKINTDFDVESIDWNTVCCMVIETCSWARGLEPYNEEFWQRVAYVQKQHDVIVIIDDIFTGGGKTGNFFGWKCLPVEPDIFTMGKGITAGHYPLSMTLYNQRIHDSLPKTFRWEHGFTYSFSLPGVVSVLEFLSLLEQQSLLSRHEQIACQARSIFENNRYQVQNQFGLMLAVRTPMGPSQFVIPLNADQDYFDTLDKNLKNHDFYRI